MDLALTYRSASEVNSAMSRVYGHMALAVLTSMIVSYLVGSNAALMAFFFTGVMKWIVIFAPLLAIIGVSVLLNASPTRGMAQFCLHGFAALMGLSLATIFVVYSMGSIVAAFMGGAILFGVMSVYGYFTKNSLDSLGKFMFVGLVAVVIASVVNIFIGSSVFAMVISAVAILVFLGLTAYDTQKIREEIMIENDGIAEIRGALTLYLDMINIFMSLLQLTGNKNE